MLPHCCFHLLLLNYSLDLQLADSFLSPSPSPSHHLLPPLTVTWLLCRACSTLMVLLASSAVIWGMHAMLCVSLQVGWRRSGLAVWSASGCRLMCSLRQTARPNTFSALSAASSSAFATDGFKPNALPMEVSVPDKRGHPEHTQPVVACTVGPAYTHTGFATA